MKTIAQRVTSARSAVEKLFHHRSYAGIARGEAPRIQVDQSVPELSGWERGETQTPEVCAQGVIRREEVPLLTRYGSAYGLLDTWIADYECVLTSDSYRLGEYVGDSEYSHIPAETPILFLEVEVEDPSELEDVLEVRGVKIGDYKVLRAESSAVPNAIAAFLLYLRDITGETPHCYFGWTQGNLIVYVIRYILFGEGDTAPVTHEVLREAEPNLMQRPIIHVSGR